MRKRSASRPGRTTRARGRRRSAGAGAARRNLAVLNPGVSGAERAPSLGELEREAGLRFVVRTRNRPQPDTIRERIREAHGLETEVEPLFESLDAGRSGGIGRRYLVTIPGVGRRDIAVNPYELGYRLAQTPKLEIEAVEPDLPHSMYAGNVATQAAAFGGILRCEVAEDPALAFTWHLDTTKVHAAWNVPPQPGGQALGEGIVVGHPDTGWVLHDELDVTAIDTTKSWDFVGRDADATDPLDKPWFSIGLLGQPGHGLGTGSVIISRRGGKLHGAAPAATLVPIRTVTRVWQIFSGDLARGIEHAATHGCHVISMSLGGLHSEALERALNAAVARDVIVCAAAGNCVHVVVAPGLYPNAVCVAASNSRGVPWVGSSRGPAVDIASPGENIWVARRKKGEAGTKRVGQSQGTSPATATVAGIAALWLAHHGRNALLSKYSGKVKLQHVFLHLLRTTAQPWSHSDAGPGVVDAEALLKAPLPSATQVAAGLPSDPFRMLAVEEVAARMVGEPDPAPVRTHLDAAFGAGTAAAATPAVGPATAAGDVEGALATFGPELLHILAEDRAAALEFRASLRPAGPTAVASAPGPVTPTSAFGTSELARVASPTLRARLRR